MGKKKSLTVPKPLEDKDSSDDEDGYLPLKYPCSGKTRNKINSFIVNNQDKISAGSSNQYPCGSCNLNVKSNQSAIECKGTCNKWYHLKCSRLETKDFDEFSKELKKPNGRRWKCHECCEPIQNSKNDNSYNNLRYLTGIVLELQRTIEFMAANYDDVKKENKEIITLLKEIKKERNLLAEENRIMKKEIIDIKNEISSLKQKIDIKEQIELKNNIEIKGIPEQDIDDEEIIQKIFFKIGIQNETREIVNIKRIKKISENSQEILKISLKNEATKFKIANAAKQYFKLNGILSTEDLGIKDRRTTIYINEELTRRNKYLLGKTKELLRSNYKYIWWKNSKIFVRKNENEKPIIINDENDIAKLAGTL